MNPFNNNYMHVQSLALANLTENMAFLIKQGVRRYSWFTFISIKVKVKCSEREAKSCIAAAWQFTLIPGHLETFDYYWLCILSDALNGNYNEL